MLDKKVYRMNILGGLGGYIRDCISDENAYMEFIMLGLPDEWDETDIEECAEDDELFVNIVKIATNIIARYDK